MKQFRLLFLSVILLMPTASFSQYGTLDSDFNDTGKVLTAFGEFHSSVRSIVIQPDGKIIAAGNMFDIKSPFSQFVLARYNIHGLLDSEFGFNGLIIENSPMQMHLHSMVLQPDDKILVAGLQFPNENKKSESIVKRYNPDGSEDLSFGKGGTVIVNSIYSTSMAIQEDGKIILAGYSLHNLFKPNNYLLTLIRFNRDGSLDESFGFKGIVSTPIRGLGSQISIAVQTDNKIVVSADAIGINDRDIIVLRYLADGLMDDEFGNKGFVTVYSKSDNTSQAVKIQPLDDKILIGGTTLPSLDSSSFMLVRLLANGDLDNNFGKLGVAIAELETTEQLKSMALQTDGMIVTSGIYSERNSETIILKRYNSEGQLDPTFGKKGIVITVFDLRSESASVSLQSDGKIVTGGQAGGSSKFDFALLRYISGVKSEPQVVAENTLFTVSPNPVDKTVNLAFNLKHSQGLTVDLYDFNGRKIQNVLQSQEFPAGSNFYTIDLPENLTKGIYFLNISNGKNISNLKIVK